MTKTFMADRFLNQRFIDWCFNGHPYWQQKYLRHYGRDAFGVRVRIWLGIDPVRQKIGIYSVMAAEGEGVI